MTLCSVTDATGCVSIHPAITKPLGSAFTSTEQLERTWIDARTKLSVNA